MSSQNDVLLQDLRFFLTRKQEILGLESSSKQVSVIGLWLDGNCFVWRILYTKASFCVNIHASFQEASRFVIMWLLGVVQKLVSS